MIEDLQITLKESKMRIEEQIITEMGKLAQLAYKKLGGHDGYNIGDIIPDFEDKEKTYKLNSSTMLTTTVRICKRSCLKEEKQMIMANSKEAVTMC